MAYYFGKDAVFTPDFFGATKEPTLGGDTKVTQEEMVLACFKGNCEMIPRGVASSNNIALCSGKRAGDWCGTREQPLPECTGDADCPEGQRCVDGKCTETITKIYCCKKCENGEVKKYQSPNPCVSPSVPCDQALNCVDINPCDDPVYAAAHPDECGGVITKVKACVGGKCVEADRNTVTDRQIFMCKELPLDDVCEHEQECTSDDQCKQHGPNWKCQDGKCIEIMSECTGDADCHAKYGSDWYCDQSSQTCKKQKGGCEKDADCDAGYKCVNGECVKEENGNGDGNGGCEGGYENPSGNPCGYGFESKGIGGVQWCCPKEPTEPLGEYTLPANMQELLDSLIARGKELLGKEVGFSEARKAQMLEALPAEGIESLAARRRELLAMRPGYEPELEAALGSLAASLKERREMIAGIEPGYTPGTIAEMIGALPKELHGKLMGRGEELLEMPLGFTPESIARMFGLDFEKIREREAGGRESLLGTLGVQGKFGTGVVPEQMGKLAWGTEQNISDLMRNLYIYNERQKREDLSRYTGLAGDIFGQGMGYADLVGRTYGGIEEKKKRDILDYTAAMLGIAPMEMAALTAPSERRKADVLDYTQAAAQIVPQEMAYARQLQDLLTSFKGMEKADILDFTGMAQGIFGVGAGSEQLVEMINAARRGEGSEALSQLLALLGLLKY